MGYLENSPAMRRFLLPALAVATLLPVASAQTTVFDNTNSVAAQPLTFPFNAAQSNEFGDYITLGTGARLLNSVSVPLTAYNDTGTGNGIPGYNLNITLRIYGVNTSGVNPAPGSVLFSVSQVIAVPSTGPGANVRVPFTATFDAISLNITLPNSFIWSIGFDPAVGTSLNLVFSEGSAGVGGYLDGQANYLQSNDTATYGPVTTFGRSTAYFDAGFTVHAAGTFSTIPEPSTVAALATLGSAALLLRRRR